MYFKFITLVFVIFLVSCAVSKDAKLYYNEKKHSFCSDPKLYNCLPIT